MGGDKLGRTQEVKCTGNQGGWKQKKRKKCSNKSAIDQDANELRAAGKFKSLAIWHPSLPYFKLNITSLHRVKFTFDNIYLTRIMLYLHFLSFCSCLHHLGLEWRLITAGENKFRMDPFKPLKQEDVEFTTKRLLKIRSSYIDLVKERRKKLDVNHKTVFTGEFFTGKEAVSMGLADGFCSDLKKFCTERYGKDVKFERCDPPKGFLSMIQSFGGETRIKLSVNGLFDEISDQQ